MNKEDNVSIEELTNSFIDFITDYDLNIAILELFGICSIQLAKIIIDNNNNSNFKIWYNHLKEGDIYMVIN